MGAIVFLLAAAGDEQAMASAVATVTHDSRANIGFSSMSMSRGGSGAAFTKQIRNENRKGYVP